MSTDWFTGPIAPRGGPLLPTEDFERIPSEAGHNRQTALTPAANCLINIVWHAQNRTVDLFWTHRIDLLLKKGIVIFWHGFCIKPFRGENKMKKYVLVITALLLVAPSLVFSDVISFKVGYFMPRAKGDPWQTEFANMSFKKSHFQTTNFAFVYEYFLSNQFSLTFGVSGYTKNKSGIYEGYFRDDVDGVDYAFDYEPGSPISHVYSVSITPLQASVKFTPLGRKGKIIPFVGGGLGAYLWTVRLSGSMIDFESPEWIYDTVLERDVIGYPIFADDLRAENKLRIGFHVLGGIMVPIANRISLEGEVKYNYLQAPFSQLEGFDYIVVGYDYFDLSGMTLSIGMNYWF